MKLTKIAAATKFTAVALSAALMFGCGSSSSSSNDNNNGGDTGGDGGGNGGTTPVPGNSVALTDTSTDNAGKLMYTLGSAQEEGSVSVKVRYSAEEVETAYVTLHADTVTSADQIASIKMDSGFSSGSNIGFKRATSASSSEDEALTQTFPEDTWATITISWDQTNYTLSVNGTEAGTWPVINANAVSAVEMKIGNNSNTTTHTFYVDDLAIYSDKAATMEVINENFDTQTVGNEAVNIDGFTEKTNEAVISDKYNGTEGSTGGGNGDTGGGTGNADNLAAQILDTNIGGTKEDTGELRIKLADQTHVTELAAGQISATIQIQPDADTTVDESSSKNDALISLYSSGTSSANLHGDIIFSGNKIKYRDDSGAQQTIDGLSYTDGQAIKFVAKWTENDYSFSIDGGTTFKGPFASRDLTPVTVITFKLGNSSTMSSYEFNVDDIIISDGTTEAYNENFEAFTEGYDLVAGGDIDQNSAEATVQKVAL
ncbi:hypothetical protein E2R68_02145 [Psychromonas sp. RZ22]|uniref:LamG-like jellyroll fold domain-containing protein n=1 Tax=Psychromonas algarum TaxID=2555643 RepID=UPI0010684E88|nr:LamG-like jellyroll fold domain-containing protein [Psychromonas sp. RZ22]TEW56853.1 hypothetical protein E2R68_02145 [Psychromonas sp. RZ22]